MEPKPTGHFRTESGTVLEMDLPLHESIAQRVTRGEIVRVMREGDRWVPFDDSAEAAAAQAAKAAERAEFEKALQRVEDLEQALEIAYTRRNELEAKVAELESALAEVTRERDELAAKPIEPASAETPSVPVEPKPARAKAKPE